MSTQLLASETTSVSLTLTVVTAVLGSSLLAGLLTAFLTGLRGSATARRDGYASALEAIVAWSEYPYRVRRRVDDTPETLSALASLGSDLQQGQARCRAWVAAESPAIGDEMGRVIEAIRARVGSAVAEAWAAPPVATAGQMNVSPFGPGDISPALDRFQNAIKWRFGIRRTVPNWWVRRRLRRAGPLALPPVPAPGAGPGPGPGPGPV